MLSPASERKLKMGAILALKSASIYTSMPYKSFMNLNIGSYHVVKFERETSILGERIRMDFNDYFMFLPQRFSKRLDDELLTELNAHGTTVMMTYSGKGSNSWPLLDFDVIRYDVDEDIF